MSGGAAPLASCLYEGTVRHRRFTPVAHGFSYRVFLLYLDLSELPRVFRRRWLWSVGRPNVASFRREDHLGDPAVPLDVEVRDLVEARLRRRPLGRVRLLTHLRYLGYGFNPVSFYYCHALDGTLDAIVAEVNNTPWGERHVYVLDARAAAQDAARGGRPALRFRFPKAFHVSPFMRLAQEYDWRLRAPGRLLSVHMENVEDGRIVLDATMTLARRPLDGPHLASALLRFPAMTAKVIAAIYWNALRLWWKRVPYVPHPGAGPRPALPAKELP